MGMTDAELDKRIAKLSAMHGVTYENVREMLEILTELKLLREWRENVKNIINEI